MGSSCTSLSKASGQRGIHLSRCQSSILPRLQKGTCFWKIDPSRLSLPPRIMTPPSACHSIIHSPSFLAASLDLLSYNRTSQLLPFTHHYFIICYKIRVALCFKPSQCLPRITLTKTPFLHLATTQMPFKSNRLRIGPKHFATILTLDHVRDFILQLLSTMPTNQLLSPGITTVVR